MVYCLYIRELYYSHCREVIHKLNSQNDCAVVNIFVYKYIFFKLALVFLRVVWYINSTYDRHTIPMVEIILMNKIQRMIAL